MTNARTAKSLKASALAAAFCLTAALIFPYKVSAAAGGVQNCTAGSTCTIGEFLYDDNSAPIAGATCTTTSKYPNLTSFLAAQALLGGGADGWYYYSFTAPATTGMYPTTISCTVSGDTLSIDKSFQVNAVVAAAPDTSSIATAVWGYSGKTLDSFGTLPADIWSYSTRTVSTFGTLVSDIWANATRTLTGANLSSGSLATQADVTAVGDKVDAIATQSGTVTNVTNNTTNNTTTNLTQDITDSIAGIKNVTAETRLLLEQVVNKPVIQNVLQDTTPPVSQKLDNTRAQANQLYVNNQFLTVKSATLAANWNSMSGKDILDAVIAISQVMGETADSSSTNTMFGESNWIRDSWNWDEAGAVNSQLTSAQNTIGDLKNGLADYQKSPSLLSEVKLLVKNSLALEKIIGTTSDTPDQKTLFAKVASTQALASSLDDKSLQISKVLGAYTKSKDYNSVSSQIADLQSQVIALNKIPGGVAAITKVNLADANSVTNNLLSLKGIIDSNKKLLALGSGQTMVNIWLEVGSIIFKTIATNPSTLISQKVEVKYYLPQELKQEDIIKTDAGLTVNYDNEKNQLYVDGTFNLGPGESRTFSVETRDIWTYSQSEIDSLRKQANDLFAPLQKTAYFAQGVTLKSDIDANLDQIVTLQAGVQTPDDKIRVHRESTILKNSVDTKLAGMKDLVTQASAAGNLFGFVGGSQAIAVWGLIIVIAAGFIFMTIYMKAITAKANVEAVAVKTSAKPEKKEEAIKHKTGGLGFLRFTAVVILSSAISAGASGLLVSRITSDKYEQKLSVLGTATSAPIQTPTPVPAGTGTGTGGQYLVVVSDTPTGFLNVRKTPGGVDVMAKVKPGDKLPYIDENAGYYQVKLESGEEGWISKQYSSKE